MVRRALLVLGFLSLVGAAASSRADPVDLELVLAVDSSGSIDSGEFRLQREGYARALMHPDVLAAIRRGAHGAVAIAFFEWSGPAIQTRVVGWTRVSGEADLTAVSATLLSAPRTIFGGGTSIAGAIRLGMELFRNSGFDGTRRVIDISGDGPNNRGPSVTAARDAAVAVGITINGLPILEDDNGLEVYFRDFVIGGPGAFVQPAQGFGDFQRAVLRKLLQELNLSRAAAGASPGG
ncbi:MAG: DUF1194 domain-containing protein [Rhodospirillaceae bacterium]